LFQIIEALGLPCLGLGSGKRGEEQRGKNGDDGNHHQQFNQGECSFVNFRVGNFHGIQFLYMTRGQPGLSSAISPVQEAGRG
jgi:hypothetical protein